MGYQIGPAVACWLTTTGGGAGLKTDPIDVRAICGVRVCRNPRSGFRDKFWSFQTVHPVPCSTPILPPVESKSLVVRV